MLALPEEKRSEFSMGAVVDLTPHLEALDALETQLDELL